MAVVGVVGSALPASAHASFGASAAFGFAPNPAGGTGATGSTPPYIPGSTQNVWLRAPFEQTVPFNGSDDTTVDVKVIVPAGFTAPVCGTANVQVNNASSNFTNQPGASVEGWSCEILTVDSHSVVHYTGPQVVAPVTAADSAQFFSFTVTVPMPAAQTTYNGKSGTEGFIVDQQYASGEIVHWIPDASYPGTPPPGSETSVAAGLARTVGGPGTKYQPVAPDRILDSRTGTGWSGKLAAGTPQNLTVTGGASSVPVDVDSVVLNVTATNGTANSFLTVYPSGVASVPTASNLNFAAGQTRPNLVTVKVGTSGQVAFSNAVGAVDVVADLVGYYSPGAPDLYNPLEPSRVLDTRTPAGGAAPVVAGTPLDFHAHVGGVPETADSVEINVTVTNGTANSFLTVYPLGGGTPNASNLNFAKGETVANLVSVKLGTDGHIAFANAIGAVDVVVDMVGYYDASSGDTFHSLAPQRILDSRTTTGGWNATPLASGNLRTLQTVGYGGVRADATGVVGNATVTNGTANSFLSVYPTGTVPSVSNLNFGAGQTVPNLTQVKIGTNGQLSFANQAGSTDVIYDVVGFFAPT